MSEEVYDPFLDNLENPTSDIGISTTVINSNTFVDTYGMTIGAAFLITLIIGIYIGMAMLR